MMRYAIRNIGERCRWDNCSAFFMNNRYLANVSALCYSINRKNVRLIAYDFMERKKWIYRIY